MATFFGYICDKCKQEYRLDRDKFQSSGGYAQQPVTISIRLEYGQEKASTNRWEANAMNSVTWCRKCALESGIDEYHNREVKKKDPEFKEPTLEERITTVLYELGFVHRDDLPQQ